MQKLICRGPGVIYLHVFLHFRDYSKVGKLKFSWNLLLLYRFCNKTLPVKEQYRNDRSFDHVYTIDNLNLAKIQH